MGCLQNPVATPFWRGMTALGKGVGPGDPEVSFSPENMSLPCESASCAHSLRFFVSGQYTAELEMENVGN